jgi:acyl-CoA thioester hydrolase
VVGSRSNNASESLGLNYRALTEAGFHLPVLDITVKYRRPAHYDDEVIIESTIREKPSIRIKVEYRLFRGDELLATASSQHAFVDQTGLPTRPPLSFVSAMAKLFAVQT